MRISKDPEERKNEILEIADKLFIKNGIGKTAVSTIVKELNIAQGLFYYYFKSKDDVIDELVKRNSLKFKESLKRNIGEGDFDHQLQDFLKSCLTSFNAFTKKYKDNRDLILISSKVVEDCKKSASEYLIKIIQKGNEYENLNIKSPEFYAKVLVGGLSDLLKQGVNDLESLTKIIDEILKKEK